MDTTFFARIGLRYINKVSGMQQDGADILDWINRKLITPVADGELGVVSNMKNKLTGQFDGESYTFHYVFASLSRMERSFLLDWDYYREDIEVQDSVVCLNAFHNVHFPFFWWALGQKAKQVLENGTTDK